MKIDNLLLSTNIAGSAAPWWGGVNPADVAFFMPKEIWQM
jgi:hypothetical protein